MERTIEDLDRDLADLRSQVELLQRREAALAHPLRLMAGCFTGDSDWRSIHEEIEAQRRRPEEAAES